MTTFLTSALLLSLALQDGTKPVAPSGWTARNWIGFFLYIVVFLLLVAFIFYVGRDEDKEEGLPDKPP
mgnify:CR=1 FL=1